MGLRRVRALAPSQTRGCSPVARRRRRLSLATSGGLVEPVGRGMGVSICGPLVRLAMAMDMATATATAMAMGECLRGPLRRRRPPAGWMLERPLRCSFQKHPSGGPGLLLCGCHALLLGL